MNIIVKSFIVINLLLSCLYCAFQVTLFANRQNYKQKYSDLAASTQAKEAIIKEKIKTLEEQIQTKEISVDTLNSRSATLSDELDKAQTNLKQKVSEMAELKQELNELRSRNALVDEKLTKNIEELSENRKQLEKARETAKSARRDLVDMREQVVAFERERSQLKGQLEITQAKQKEFEKQVFENNEMISKLERHGIDITAIVDRHGEPELPIHAKVMAVKPDVNIVLLSVGTKDKVKEGYRFTIYQGESYKGKVQVESVYPTLCSARILPELLSKNQTIQEGDNASTRVY